MKIHNFSAGPSILAEEVFKEASQGILNFNQSGLSILEMSHRSKAFVGVLDEAIALVRELLHVGDDHAVLFLSGGASSQFFMAPMNFLNESETAAYMDTGTWSAKAIKEARNFGHIDVVASSREDRYTHIPKKYEIPQSAVYLHLTTNNTVYGTQFRKFPETTAPIIADMSSDIFSYPVNFDKMGLVYAGAQKNMGPAGTTLVIVRKDWLGRVQRTIPSMLKYQTHIDKNSSFNTPPVFPIYVSMLNLRWVKANGGVDAMQKRSIDRSNLIYSEIDRNGMFEGTTVVEDRSRMNATYRLKENFQNLEGEFLNLCKEAGISGLKGHRSVGGFRASMYNALPLESVKLLVEVMKDFEKEKG